MKGEVSAIKKIIFLFSLVMLIFICNPISAKAWGNCGGKYCGCKEIFTNSTVATAKTCAGQTCWYNGVGGCDGHAWQNWYVVGSSTTTAGTQTCTTGAVQTTVTTWKQYCAQTGCSGTRNADVPSQVTLPPLGHDDTDVWHHEGIFHKKYCKRCGVLLHTETHNWGAWHYEESGYHYQNCEDKYACDAINPETYNFTVIFNANGGILVGSSSKTMVGGTDTYNLGTTATRYGYHFEQWGTSSDWCEVRYDSYNDWRTASGWASVCGKSIQYGNNSGTLYAQWTKTVTHTFRYFNNQSQTATVTFHNGDTSKEMGGPSAALNDASYKNYNWSCKGISTSSAANALSSYVTSITVYSSDNDKTYYSS